MMHLTISRYMIHMEMDIGAMALSQIPTGMLFSQHPAVTGVLKLLMVQSYLEPVNTLFPLMRIVGWKKPLGVSMKPQQVIPSQAVPYLILSHLQLPMAVMCLWLS